MTDDRLTVDTQRWREQLLNRLLWLLLALGTPVLGYAFYLGGSQILIAYLLGYGALAALALARNQSLVLRAGGLCLVVFLVGSVAIYQTGVASSGRLYLGLSILVSGVLLGLRFGLVLFVASIAVMVIIGYSATSGFHTVSGAGAASSVEIASWVFYLGSYITTVGIAIASIQYLMRRTERALSALRREILEKQIAQTAERTSEEHFEFLASNTSDIIWTTDLDFRLTSSLGL